MNRGILVLFIAVAGILCLSLGLKLLDDDVPREKLGSVINSEYQEVRPLISPDGQTLYFSRRYHPQNTGGPKDYQDIWVSYQQNGTWSEPVKLSEPLNNKKTNTLCSITSDGSYALLLDSYKRVKTPLAQANDSPAGWGAPDDLVIADFVNRSSYYDFYFHEQSEVILSAIDDGRGNGQQDLHISFKKKDGTYSKPKNLGNIVNTPENEFAPFLAADGKTLYFASFGHDGFGGSDFFVCYRLDDSWKRWTEPVNLGPGINTEMDENYLSITGDFSYIYFESYPEGSPEKDIYRARLPRQFHPESLAPKIIEDFVATTPTPEPTLPLTYTPINESYEQPVSEPLEKASQSEPYRATPKTDEKASATSEVAQSLGTATVKQKSATPTAGQKSAKPVGKQPALASTASASTQSIGPVATRQTLENGQISTRVLNNNYFQYNSYELSNENRSRLKYIAGVLLSNPVMEVHLEGHADSWGTDDVNLRVSYLRAQAAAHFLIDQGVSGQRLKVTGLGESSPLASNDDEKEGRELNRRVEITLSSPAGVYRYSLQ